MFLFHPHIEHETWSTSILLGAEHPRWSRWHRHEGPLQASPGIGSDREVWRREMENKPCSKHFKTDWFRCDMMWPCLKTSHTKHFFALDFEAPLAILVHVLAHGKLLCGWLTGSGWTLQTLCLGGFVNLILSARFFFGNYVLFLAFFNLWQFLFFGLTLFLWFVFFVFGPFPLPFAAALWTAAFAFDLALDFDDFATAFGLGSEALASLFSPGVSSSESWSTDAKTIAVATTLWKPNIVAFDLGKTEENASVSQLWMKWCDLIEAISFDAIKFELQSKKWFLTIFGMGRPSSHPTAPPIRGGQPRKIGNLILSSSISVSTIDVARDPNWSKMTFLGTVFLVWRLF